MSLMQKLQEKKVLVETVEIDGDKFEVRGLSKLARSKVFAEARSKSGKVNSDKLESLLLCACVLDAATGEAICEPAKWQEWESIPSHVTAPLVAAVMKVCGLDRQDLGDPKDSDSTES